MALTKVVLRSLTQPRPPFSQVRLISHARFESISKHLEDISKASNSRPSHHPWWSQEMPELELQMPVISGGDVSFPLQELMQPSTHPDAESDFNVATAVGSDALPSQPLDHDSSSSRSEADCEDILKSFEVPGSTETAARLFRHIEHRAVLFHRLHAAKVSEASRKSREPRPIPSIGGQMETRFGNAENVATLVSRFARIAYDVANSESRREKTDAVVCSLQDILGRQVPEHIDVDAIVDAVSGAQHRKECQEVAYTACDAIRFLSFENVWQKLSAEQRKLVTNGPSSCQGDKIASHGLVDGVKAFEKSWQNLSDEHQCLARTNLESIAQRDLAYVEGC